MHRSHDARGHSSSGRRGATRRHRESLARPDLRAAGGRGAVVGDRRRARARARAVAPVAVRADDRAAHADEPLAGARRADRSDRRSVRVRVPCTRTTRCRRRDSSTTRSRTSAGPAATRDTTRRTGRARRTPGSARRRTSSTAATRRWNVAAYVEWMHRVGRRQGSDRGERGAHRRTIGWPRRFICRSEPWAGLTVDGPEIARVSAWVDSGWARWVDCRSSCADAAGLVAPRRTGRRLDTRPKSLLALKLWHPRSSAGANAAYSKR